MARHSHPPQQKSSSKMLCSLLAHTKCPTHKNVSKPDRRNVKIIPFNGYQQTDGTWLSRTHSVVCSGIDMGGLDVVPTHNLTRKVNDMSRTITGTITLILAVSTASLASADTYFGTIGTLEPSGTLELGLITSDGDGVVEVYDYHTGMVGALLGVEDVHFGANTDVRVHTGIPVTRDVIAVVKVNGQIVAEKEFDVQSN